MVPRRFGGGLTGPHWIIYANMNLQAPLPAVFAGGALPVVLTVRVGDDLARALDRVENVELRVLLSGVT